MFKENFERICAEKGLSPTTVCVMAGISKSNYSNWGNTSTPRKSNLIKLAKVLQIEIDELLRENPLTIGNKKQGTFVETSHIVAYIDFLGTKKLIESNVSLASLFSSVYTEIKNDINLFMEIENFQIQEKIFSDNIVLALKIENDDTKLLIKKLNYFFAYISSLQYYLLKNYKLTMRGGIGIGKLYIDEKFLIGKVLDDVYYLEETVAIYPRIIIGGSIVPKLKSINLINTHTRKDFDGEYFIDYLRRTSVKDNLEINDIIDKLFDNSLEKGNIKIPISQKLNWLNTYNNSYIHKKSNTQNNRYGSNYYTEKGDFIFGERKLDNLESVLIQITSQMTNVQKQDLVSHAFEMLKQK